MNISISKVKLFKACRRAYFFKYVEGLEPVKKAEALETGLRYHELIEKMYVDGNIDVGEDYSKEHAMAVAYGKYIYPYFNVKSTEEWFEFYLRNGHKLIGRVDGIAEDGCIVEHKTTSSEINPQYEYNLMWDEQILAYMMAKDVRKMYYTVCRKPTIRQKQNESEEEFYNRMIEWYDIDTDSKIRIIEIERTDEEIEAFQEQLEATANDMQLTNNYYPNCLWCNVWGRRCEYSSICLNYDPKETYIEFTKEERK